MSQVMEVTFASKLSSKPNVFFGHNGPIYYLASCFQRTRLTHSIAPPTADVEHTYPKNIDVVTAANAGNPFVHCDKKL
jgi:hypothetical protein